MEISIDLWLCVFMLGGSSQDSQHSPVVQYLLYGSIANLSVRALTDLV